MSNRQTKIKENSVTYFTSDTTGALAVSKSEATPKANKQWVLNEVRISLDAVGASGTLTITINDASGAAYDHVLLTQDMTAIQYLRYVPSGEVILAPADTIDIAWANANTKTYGLTVIKQLKY